MLLTDGTDSWLLVMVSAHGTNLVYELPDHSIPRSIWVDVPIVTVKWFYHSVAGSKNIENRYDRATGAETDYTL